MANGSETPIDLQNELQKTANENSVLVMSFIAPDTIVKKSPTSYDYAQITYQDLYNIEAKIEPLKKLGTLPKKLHLIIHTPGGRVDATTKIARYLRENFEEIEAYVPYEAASGGTVLCLAANRIVMCNTSNLTPIDPQVSYKGRRVSVVSYEQAIKDMMKKYSTNSPDEIPSPDQQMCNQFDPIVAKEFSKMVFDSIMIAIELLEESQKPTTTADNDRIWGIAFALTKTDFPHDHQFDIKSAKDIGLTIVDDASKLNLLNTYKKWVSCKLNEKETNHIVETYIPQKEEEQKDEKPNKASKKPAAKK